MQGSKVFRVVRPLLSAFAVIALAAVLVFTIFFTQLGQQWIIFLSGILVAAILAEATRMSRAEWVVMRRTAQLSSLKDRLEREMQLRKRAEEAIAASKPRLHLIDEVLPIMVALIDIEGRCRYHNRAFQDWLRLPPEQINGRHMREVLGAKVYQETATAVRQSLNGQAAHYERTQKMQDGSVYRLSVEHLPQFGEDGKVTGFYMLIKDITGPGDVRMPAQLESTGPGRAGSDAVVPALVQDGTGNQNMFVQSFSEQITGYKDAGSRIMAAIEKNEFRLFCQLITPLAVSSGEAEHYEILVRLMEEEEGMMPPGAFFPLAEKYGLMPNLDRWVVQHVTEWVAHQNPQGWTQESSMLFINVSLATIGDPGFPEFLQLTLLEHGVPGAALCFEIPGSELASRSADVAEFARQVRQCGCRVALSGFGREHVLFDLIRGFQVDFLKIDGSIILYILRDPVYLARVTAISRVAKEIGVKTIAELVESEEIITSLREIGIDFAQGFGISRPRPLAG
ncbi:MAG: EAL domain-containing protein [Nitrosomonadales bacterium]|nr:EAL domain-containing protein [Nitrosomonadales bacterium]